jgi:hypothetical protein
MPPLSIVTFGQLKHGVKPVNGKPINGKPADGKPANRKPAKVARTVNVGGEQLSLSRPSKRLTVAKKPVIVSDEEYQRRVTVLVDRLRNSIAVRFIQDADLRSTYLRNGIYALIRSHQKKAITSAKMVPLIDHERDIRRCETLSGPEHRWRVIMAKCQALGVNGQISERS